jgi:RHS repeat-associated protein
VTQIVHRRTSDNTVLAFNEYEYDAAGNRTSMTDMAGTHTFAYDDLHRLISATHPAASALPSLETFTLDAVGNRLADARITGYTYDAANRLLENSSYTYTYDADGNQLSAGATSFAYTSENALLSVMMPNAREVRYEYDAFGRRIVKSTGTATARVVTQYAYDGDEVLALIDYAAVVLGVITNGPGTDEPLMIREIGGIEWYMHADALGSIVALTAPDGSLRERIEYGAFGETRYVNIHNGGTVSSQSISRNRAAFTARENDSEYGRYYYRERQTYDPVTGRFGQEDPIGFRGGLNFYTYVGGSPTNYADPTGECPWCVAAGVGAAVGAGLDLAEQIINSGAGCIDWSSVGMSAALGAGLSGLGPTGWAIGRGGARAAKYGYNATAPWLNRGGFRFGWSQTNKSDVLSLRIGKVHHDLIPQKFGVASGARPGRDGAMAGLTAAGARDSGGNCGCKKQ